MTVVDHQSRDSSGPTPATRSNGGHIVLVVIGTLLALAGLTLAGLAAAFGWATNLQRDGQFLTGPVHRFASAGYAVTSERLDVVIDRNPVGQRDLNRLMLRATSADPDGDVFVGVGPQREVTEYLADVQHSEIVDLGFGPFRVTYRQVPGTRAPEPPGEQSFWVAQDEGAGTRQVDVPVRSGTWMAVVMNADGSSPVAADVQAGARSELSLPLTIGTGVGAIVLLAAGVTMLVVGAAGLGRQSTQGRMDRVPAAGAVDAAATIYPARLTGHLDRDLSRWLWLVKWFLAIPHVIVLAFLFIAFAVTTLVAWFAILFTGRYPRGLFDFNVGVLRWGWRVGFYAYSALGTDQYPPFTLARTDYPADFDVAYPERLSRGLVLIKSWLLAIPHLLIVAIITGNTWYWVTSGEFGATDVRRVGGISLLGLLVLIAAVVLLFTGRYPATIFDLLLGANRWIYRVIAYVALMRDEYPPFRLDQGPDEPELPRPAARAPEGVGAAGG